MEPEHYYTDPRTVSWSDLKAIATLAETEKMPGFHRLLLYPVFIGLKIFGRPTYAGVYPRRSRDNEIELDSLSETLQLFMKAQEAILINQGFVVGRRLREPAPEASSFLPAKLAMSRVLLFRGDIGVQILVVDVQGLSQAMQIPPPKPEASFIVESFCHDHLPFKTGTAPTCAQSCTPGDIVSLPGADVETLIKNHLERKAQRGGNAIWFETADAYMDAVDAEAERDLAWQVKKGMMIKATPKQLEKLKAAGRI